MMDGSNEAHKNVSSRDDNADLSFDRTKQDTLASVKSRVASQLPSLAFFSRSESEEDARFGAGFYGKAV
jgi:hypothetical protein